MHLTSGILVLSSSLAAAVSPVPSLLAIREEIYPQPKVISFRLSGNGCPQGSTVVSTAHIWDNFSFDLPKFQVAIGGSSSPVKKSVNCQAHLNVGSSSGWQFALKDVWSTGHLDLEGPGVTLTQYITQYYSQSPKDSTTTRLSYSSPANSTVAERLTLHSAVPVDALIWSPCSSAGILNVNFRMAFTSTDRDSSGYYGGNKNSTVVNERWGWSFRRC